MTTSHFVKLKDVSNTWKLSGVTRVINGNNDEEIFIFGAENDGTVYKYNKINKIFEKFDVYPNKSFFTQFKPHGHNVITFSNVYTLSFGGLYGFQHLYMYNHTKNKWITDLKYNKKEYYIYEGSKSQIMNIKNNKYVVISCLNSSYKNYFYFFDINKKKFIKKLKQPKEFNHMNCGNRFIQYFFFRSVLESGHLEIKYIFRK